MAGTTLCNQFDGLSPSGTAVSTSNSAASSGAAFDAVTTGSGATLASDTAHVAHGSFSLKCATGATAALSYVNWGTSLGTVTTCYFRVYGYFTANPGSTVLLARFGRSGGTGFAGGFQVTTTGKINFIDANNAQQLISTSSIPLGSWWRLEGYITGSATAGRAQFKCYFSGLDSLTATETQTSAATLNTGAAVTSVRFGIGNSLASIGPFWIDDIGVTSSGYLGPSQDTQTHVGASVFSGTYGSSQLQKQAGWDAVLQRDMGSGPGGAIRCYYKEGELPSAASDSQGVVNLASHGIKCCVSFHPWRDTTNHYSGTIPGQSITYAQELANLGAAVQYYLDNGVQAHQLEVALWHEENYQGYNGDFGTKGGYAATTNTQAAQNYAAYFAFYAPAIASKGIKLTYVASMSADPGEPSTFFPGTQNAALAAYHSTLAADYYWPDYNGSHNATLTGIAATADSFGCKLAIWEWGFTDGANSTPTWEGGTQPSPSQWVTWATGSATAGGQVLQVFLSRKAAGKPIGDLIWFAGSGGLNNITSGTPSSVLAAVQQVYDSLAVKSASVTVRGTFTLTAAGSDVSGNVHFGSAAITGTLTLSATGTGATVPAAQILTIFTLVTSGAGLNVILQQAEGTATFDYGLSSIEISTQQGSTLVLLAGWDLSAAMVTAPMPALNVADSAGNLWRHVATTSSGVSGARAAAWYCPNAQAIEWLSASLTTFASSLAYKVLELNGAIMPQDYVLDVAGATSSASAQSLALAPGVTSGAGFGFAVLAAGSFTPPPVVSGNTGWSPLGSVTAGAVPSGANPVQVFPYYQAVTAGENLATTFTASQALPVAGVAFSVLANALPPAQPDPLFPVLKVEAGFGWLPGDPSQAPPQWTDITSRCMSKDGDFFIQSSAGRQYELSAPEAGTLTVAIDNHDGAFTPGNASSPYYPDVTLGTPVRVSAYWQGAWYAVASGFAERWPQEWPDLPQWGMSRMVATDGISAMAAVTMVSAMDADVLIDAPYVLLPAAEQYLSFSNGLNSFGGSGFSALGYYNVSDAQGLSAQNVSRINQRAGVYVDGQGNVPGGTTNAIAATGQTTNLLGTSNTGFGTSSIGTSTAASGPLSGPGIIYTDPGLPDPVTGNGVTVSFWVIIPATVSVASLQPTVFTAYGTPTSYPSGKASLSVRIMNLTGSSTLQVTLADGTTVTAPFSVSASPQRITLTLTSSALAVYVNGALSVTAALTAAQTGAWTAVALGCPNYAYASAGTAAGNFTAFGLAIHACAIPVQRIVSQYNTGISGQQNATATTRLAQILSWAGLSLPRAGRATFNGATENVLQGPAYSLSGSNAAAALGQVVVNESGMAAAQPTGEIEFIPRWGLLNQSPAVTFGDNPDPSAGEIPYAPGQSWGFDNSHLASIFQVAQQFGPNTLFTAVGADQASEQQYNPRSGPQVTIQTMSAQDATDMINWLLAKYSQPGLRVAALTVNAAANPAAAFPAVLALRQGQVATVIRRPLGAAVLQQNVMVQKVQHSIGAKRWTVSFQLSPYDLEANVLQLDTPGFDIVGGNSLA